jgi:hypothetical protein
MIFPVSIFVIFLAFAGASQAPKKEEHISTHEFKALDSMFFRFKTFFSSMGKELPNVDIINLFCDVSIFNALTNVPDEAIAFLVGEFKKLFNRRKTNIYFVPQYEPVKDTTKDMKLNNLKRKYNDIIGKFIREDEDKPEEDKPYPQSFFDDLDSYTAELEKADKHFAARFNHLAPVIKLIRAYNGLVEELEFKDELGKNCKLYLPDFFDALDAFTQALKFAYTEQNSVRFSYLVTFEVLKGDLIWVLYNYTEKLLEIFGKLKTKPGDWFSKYTDAKASQWFDKRIEAIKKVKEAASKSLRDPATVEKRGTIVISPPAPPPDSKTQTPGGSGVKTAGIPTIPPIGGNTPPISQTPPQTDPKKGTPHKPDNVDTNLPKPPTPKSQTDIKNEEPKPTQPPKGPAATTIPPPQTTNVPGKPAGDIPPVQPGSNDTKKEEPKKEPIVTPPAGEKPKDVIPPIVPPKTEEPRKEPPPTTPAKQGEPASSVTTGTKKFDDDKTTDPKMEKKKAVIKSDMDFFSKIHGEGGKIGMQNEKLFSLLNQEAYATVLVSVSETQSIKLVEILKNHVFSPATLSKLIPTATPKAMQDLYSQILNCLGSMTVPKLLENIVWVMEKYQVDLKQYLELLEYSLREYTSNSNLWTTEADRQKIQFIHDACRVPDSKKSDNSNQDDKKTDGENKTKDPEDNDKKTKDLQPGDENKTKVANPDDQKKTIVDDEDKTKDSKPDDENKTKDPKTDVEKKTKQPKLEGTDALNKTDGSKTEGQTPIPNKEDDGYTRIIILVVIVALFVAILGIGGYLFINRNKENI